MSDMSPYLHGSTIRTTEHDVVWDCPRCLGSSYNPPETLCPGKVAELVAEVKRLKALLDCEAGISAPEGWAWVHYRAWTNASGSVRVYRAAEAGKWWTIDEAGTLTGPYAYALAAIEAAEQSHG